MYTCILNNIKKQAFLIKFHTSILLLLLAVNVFLNLIPKQAHGVKLHPSIWSFVRLSFW